MVKPTQHRSWISRTWRRAAGTALVLSLLCGLRVATAQTQQTWAFTVLYSFTGSSGAYPYANVFLDSAGNLYGTTLEGGIHDKGTVFMLDTAGNEKVLHNFTGQADGELPYGGLVRDSYGNLYGTTSNGGRGYGVVFKVNAAGKETVLFNFTGPKGAVPQGTLLRDAAGNLYGTTYSGGADGGGTAFKVSNTGEEKVLHSFGGGNDGSFPSFVKLVRDKVGNFFGTTLSGGNNYGTIFKMNKRGKETVLYMFQNKNDGKFPYAGLVRDASGILYGTTAWGGASDDGTVFKFDIAAGQETVLYSFCSGGGSCPDGRLPYSDLVMDAAGNLYGTTSYGGNSACDGCGTVFKLDKTGTETVLYAFTGGLDGAIPVAGLIQDKSGNLYGTATGGGSSGYGTVWKLTP